MKLKNVKSLLVFLLIIVFSLSGCTKNVKDKEISIKVEGENLKGAYTGTIIDGVPEGEGCFVVDTKDRKFEYDGQWKKGKILGKGTLNDNKYVVHFPEVDRTGEYSGDVKDGKADGKGTFTAINDKKVKYTYTGAWKDGLYNGKGVLKYDNEDYYVRTGTFKDGEFYPTKLEFINSMGDTSDMSFVPTEKAQKFIKIHDNFFPADEDTDVSEYIDTSISYKNLIKRPDKYGDKLIRLSNYKVLQIWEDEVGEHTRTSFLACSSSYDDYVYGFYLDELPNVYEDSTITIEGLPISDSKFENTGGGTTLCYIIYASKIK